MTTLGVFRDDVYNYVNMLPGSKFTSISQASGTLAATAMTGAQEVYVSSSGATALTTDTAANIIEQFRTSIRANALGIQPLVANLQGVSYTLAIRNTNAGTLTLSAGTGVTLVGTATIATTVQEIVLVTVTSPTTVSIQFT